MTIFRLRARCFHPAFVLALLLVSGLTERASASVTWSPSDPTGTGALTANTTVTLTDQNYTLNQALSGAFSLTVAGNSTLNVSKFQNFTGGTIIESGATVNIAFGEGGHADGVLPKSITINGGGTLNFAANSAMSYGNGTPTVNVNGGAITSTCDSPTATHVIFKTLNFTNGGTFSTTTATTGWGGNVALDGNVTVNSGNAVITAPRIVLSTRYASSEGGNDFNGTMTVAADASLTINGSLQNVEANTSSVATNARSLTKAGAGTLILNGKATYQGATKITAGTLKIGVTDAISSAKLNLAGGTLDLNGFNLAVTPNAPLIGNITNGGSAKSTLTLSIASGNSYDISGVMTGNSALTLTGGGTLEVASAQTFTGGVTIQQGTMKITAAKGADYWVAALSKTIKNGVLLGTITIEKEGTLQLTKGSAMGYDRYENYGMPELVVKGGTIENSLSDTHNLLWNMTLSEDAVIKDSTAGKTGWAGNYGLDGKVTVTSGTGNVISAEQIMLSARYTPVVGTVPFEVQENAVLTLDGNVKKTSANGAAVPNLEKTGAGELVLTGASNTYSGVTTVSAGTLTLDGTGRAASAITYATSGINVGGGEELATLNLAFKGGQSLEFTNPGTVLNVGKNGRLIFSSDGDQINLAASINVTDTGRMVLDVNGGTADQLALDGALNLATFDSLLIDLTGVPPEGSEYSILEASEGILVGGAAVTSVEQFVKFLSSNAQRFLNVSMTGTGGFVLSLNDSAVPEPATVWLLLLGFAGMLKLRKSRTCR